VVIAVLLATKLYASVCLDADFVVVHVEARLALAAVVTLVVRVAHADSLISFTFVTSSCALEVAVASCCANVHVS